MPNRSITDASTSPHAYSASGKSAALQMLHRPGYAFEERSVVTENYDTYQGRADLSQNPYVHLVEDPVTGMTRIYGPGKVEVVPTSEVNLKELLGLYVIRNPFHETPAYIEISLQNRLLQAILTGDVGTAVTFMLHGGRNLVQSAIDGLDWNGFHRAAGLKDANRSAAIIENLSHYWPEGINRPARGGITPLHVAAMKGLEKNARKLWEHGADPTLTTYPPAHETPRQMAERYGYLRPEEKADYFEMKKSDE